MADRRERGGIKRRQKKDQRLRSVDYDPQMDRREKREACLSESRARADPLPDTRCAGGSDKVEAFGREYNYRLFFRAFSSPPQKKTRLVSRLSHARAQSATLAKRGQKYAFSFGLGERALQEVAGEVGRLMRRSLWNKTHTETYTIRHEIFISPDPYPVPEKNR